MRSLLAAALLVGLAPAAPVPKELKKKDDATAIVGTWKVGEITVNGRKTDVSYDTFTFNAEGGVTLRYRNQPAGGSSWSFTLEPSVSPRRMQWSTGQGKVDWELVYDLNGDDLKVGFINKGAKPPTAVEPGEGLTLYVMSRDTSGK